MIHDRLCIREVRPLDENAPNREKEEEEEEEEEERAPGSRRRKKYLKAYDPAASRIIEGSVNQYTATVRGARAELTIRRAAAGGSRDFGA